MDARKRGRPTFDELLAHERFVRSLAARLVVDEARADDVVQQTWLAALASDPVSVHAPRAWLAGVVRHMARRLMRTETRVRERERAAAQPEALPSVEEAMRRESARRELVDAVFALEEPFRTTLMLRYLEELPRRRVAERMGVPVETVHSRLRRALELLRARLDQRHDNQRRTWCVALAPFAARSKAATFAGLATTVSMGVIAMSLPVKTASAAVTIALVGAVVFLGTRGDGDARARKDASVGSNGASSSPATVDSLPPAPLTATAAGDAERRDLASETPPARAAAQTGSIEVTVRVDGAAPTQRLTFQITAHAGASGIARAPRAATDAAGIARFDAVAPGEYSILCDRGGGMATPAAVVAGETAHVNFTIPSSFRIDGEVVDARGAGVADAEICLSRYGQFEEDFIAATTDHAGRFVVEHVAGLVYVGARKRELAASPLRCAFAALGTKSRSVRLVLKDPGAAIAGRVVDRDGAPLRDARVVVDADGLAYANADDGSPGIGTYERYLWTDSAGAFSVDSLAPGEHKVVIRKDGLMPFVTTARVDAGMTAELSAVLLPGAVISGSVRTADREALAGVGVSCGRGGTFSESSFGRTASDGTFRLTGLPAGALVVFTDAGERGKAKCTAQTESGQEAHVELVLSRGLDLVGRIVDESSAPVPGAEVIAMNDPRGSSSSSGFSGYAVADAEGRFQIANCPDHALQLVVKWPRQPLMPALIVGGIRASAGEATVRLEQASRPSANLIGHVRDPAGAPLAGAECVFMRCDGPFGTIVLTNSDGAFSSPLLAPAEYRVEIRRTGFASISTPSLALARDEVRDLGELRLGSGGSLTVNLKGGDAGLLESLWIYFTREDDDSPASLERHGAKLVAHRLAAGRYRLQLGGPTVAATSVCVDVRDGGDESIELPLVAAVPVTVAIKEAKRSARTRAPLLIIDASGAEPGDVRFRGAIPRAADGSFGYELALEPGSYIASTRGDDGLAVETEFRVGASDAVAVELLLR